MTPAGEYVERSLLARLQQRTGLTRLAPAHRLDRDTAGVVLFVVKPEARAAFHKLFADHTVEREYLAIAHVASNPDGQTWTVKNRLEPGQPWFYQRVVDGPTNATTVIELLKQDGALGLFRLLPQTGKKHQLRVHMASIGFPIVGDSLYGSSATTKADDPPLQLLAHRLLFVDPIRRSNRTFTSLRTLQDLHNIPLKIST